ncbi:hypothetical protein DSCA_37430 [Desulfosarcina alkanivorans]|jgi:acyl-coenzyme A thioesterase PaaI-like protein|uniref:Thioesterase n=1 Tax=Desulfosarcina alkanivorans TaxID=571177 RepID=A0A5K7YN22_9BACT|nr:YiiD C-terminal domain-containing protein [Desulfosarcina alkanivorans]BBO69813.1 hypothetical protein DSCA_37430 [Desulfosarcina alkanivorans]
MGLKVMALERGYVKLIAPIGGNENHIGSIYAGAIFTLAEMPGGALFMSTFDASRYYPVVKDLNLRFRRPSFGDVSIEISLSKEEIRRINGEVAEKGKADYELIGEIRDPADQVVALSCGLYQMRVNGS